MKLFFSYYLKILARSANTKSTYLNFHVFYKNDFFDKCALVGLMHSVLTNTVIMYKLFFIQEKEKNVNQLGIQPQLSHKADRNVVKAHLIYTPLMQCVLLFEEINYFIVFNSFNCSAALGMLTQTCRVIRVQKPLMKVGMSGTFIVGI